MIRLGTPYCNKVDVNETAEIVDESYEGILLFLITQESVRYSVHNTELSCKPEFLKLIKMFKACIGS